MTIRDIAAQNASLDNDYGPSHGPGSPAAFELAIWVGDPGDDTTAEMAPTTDVDDGTGTGDTVTVANGYARASVANDATWAAADGGLKATVAPVQFADAAAEWPDTGTHWALVDPATGVMWDCDQLSDPLDVTAAGPGPAIIPQVYFGSFFDRQGA